MLIIPAIDIIDGKCVRLTQGDYSRVKEYYSDPLEVALKFRNDGAKFLHVVDLEGAKIGSPVNIDVVARIISESGLPVQVGGGIRSLDDASKIFGIGAKRIILGTSALDDISFVKDLIVKFGTDSIAVSVDVKNGALMTNGWTANSGLELGVVLERLRSAGLEILIFTDIKKDGMLQGVNFELVEKVLKYGFKVIVAGGVSSMDDIERLDELGAYGCIVGKALYEGKIKFGQICNGLAKRIIPCMDIKNGRVVKGVNFLDLKDAGDPVKLGGLYSEMGADELVFLDITATIENRKTLYELVEKISENINIPFTVGGGIRDVSDVRALLMRGADKVSIGSCAVKRPSFVNELAEAFGSQCVVISVDAKKAENGWEIYINGGRDKTGIDAVKFAKQMEAAGAGELLVNSLDRDGTKNGYDIDLLKAISENVNIPVIASSGAGCKEDFLKAFTEANVDAVLAASLFHYGEISISELKEYLIENNIIIRI